MSSTLIFLNVANVLYVVCYLVKDVLLLRILAVAAMLAIIPYYWLHHSNGPMFEPLVWNGVFMAINVFWIVMIFRERQPPRLTEDEKDLYETTFRKVCSERDMLRILELAQWKEAAKGDLIIKANTESNLLMLIHSGKASVRVEGKRIAQLSAGDLGAEMSFITGQKTNADVIADGPLRYIVWTRGDLLSLFDQRPELRNAVYQLIGHDLVAKLSSTHSRVAEYQTQIDGLL